jgi:hypothetical protein
VAGIIFLSLDKGNQAQNADYDGFKQILTTLRKKVFSYVDIEAKGVAAWQAAATIFLSLDEGNQA